MHVPLPDNETIRLAVLRQYQILDTPPEAAFDDLARLAAFSCGTPIALINLIDADRQWFKARVGLDRSEAPRCVGFCSLALLQSDLLIISDTWQDARFANDPLVTADPRIRFYAGVPLMTSGGYALGTLSVADSAPRQLSEEQIEALRALARQVITQLELRRILIERKQAEETLQHSQQQYAALMHSIDRIVWEADAQTLQFSFVGKQAERLLGYPVEQWLARPSFW